MAFSRTDGEIIAAAKERAARRERALYQYPGDAAQKQIAQEMWSAMMRDPPLTRRSARRLAEMFPGISHVTAHRIRKWILSIPRPPGPPLL